MATEIENLKLALSLAKQAVDPDAVTGMSYTTDKSMPALGQLHGVKSVSVLKIINNALDGKEDIFEGATVEILKGPDKND